MYLICGTPSIWTVLGGEILARVNFLFLCVFLRAKRCVHSRFWGGNPKLCLLDFLKMLVFAPSQIYTRVFYLWTSIDLKSAWMEDSRWFHFSFFLRVVARFAMRHTRVFGVKILNYAYCSLFALPQKVHTCVALVEFYRFEQCSGKWFSPMSIFLSPSCFCALCDAAHSRFWCRDPKQCLLGFLKMLVLALPQICTPVFHLWNSIDLDTAWVENSRPCQFSFLLRIAAHLAMPHTHVFGNGIPQNVYLTF